MSFGGVFFCVNIISNFLELLLFYISPLCMIVPVALQMNKKIRLDWWI